MQMLSCTHMTSTITSLSRKLNLSVHCAVVYLFIFIFPVCLVFVCHLLCTTVRYRLRNMDFKYKFV